jgi:aminoglycoside phosphotransferase (APT) family kinase protein
MTQAAPMTAMQSALAQLLSASHGPVTVREPVPVFGGNARKAWAFDCLPANEPPLPCILLSQVAAKHIESDPESEFRILEALHGSGAPAPRALAFDAEGRVTGSPAIVLERMEGSASAVDFLAMPYIEGQAIAEDFARAAGLLHRFVPSQAGGDPVAEQIGHWRGQFLRCRLEPHPVLHWLMDWLAANAPKPQRLCMVHGDLRPGNFLYQNGKVTALLDWEMAHVGDPAEDIAWAYRALWSPERFLPLGAFVAIHAGHAGFAVSARNLAFYRIFSEAKFAAISLAAAHAFASGGTMNLRHIDRAAKVPECLRLALGWIVDYEAEDRDAAA